MDASLNDLFPFTDTVIHAAESADRSAQPAAKQPVFSTSPPGHASAEPVLHPAGLAAEQHPKVKPEAHQSYLHRRSIRELEFLNFFFQTKAGSERSPGAAAPAVLLLSSSGVADAETGISSRVQLCSLILSWYFPALLLHTASFSQQHASLSDVPIPFQYELFFSFSDFQSIFPM